MNYIKIVACTLCCALSAYGCQSELLTVYKIDVQQGNALEVEPVNKITLGMTKEQVNFVLGSPLIVDSFHLDRWDYVYLFIPGYGEREHRRLTLLFDRDEVIDIIKHNIVADDTVIKKDDENKDNGGDTSTTKNDSKNKAAENKQEALEQ